MAEARAHGFETQTPLEHHGASVISQKHVANRMPARGPKFDLWLKAAFGNLYGCGKPYEWGGGRWIRMSFPN